MTSHSDSSSTARLVPHIEALRTPAHAVAGFGELLLLELTGLDLPAGTQELLTGLSSACEEFIDQLDQIDVLAAAVQTQTAEPSPPEQHLAAQQQTRVLIVDDSPANQLLTTAQLERLNVETASATSGEAAIERLQTERFSLILMDWHMPGLDGLETTKMIREQEQQRGQVPHKIVALTARAMVGDKERCLEAGMDDFLAKPVSLDNLRQVLDAHVLASPDANPAARAPQEPAVVVRSSPAPLIVEPIDPDIYYALVADIGNIETVHSLANTFRVELAERLTEFDQAHEADDVDTMRRSVHTIKGTSALLGATPLGECAAELEAQCQSGTVDPLLITTLHRLGTATDSSLQALTSADESAIGPLSVQSADRAA